MGKPEPEFEPCCREEPVQFILVNVSTVNVRGPAKRKYKMFTDKPCIACVTCTRCQDKGMFTIEQIPLWIIMLPFHREGNKCSKTIVHCTRVSRHHKKKCNITNSYSVIATQNQKGWSGPCRNCFPVDSFLRTYFMVFVHWFYNRSAWIGC